MNSDEFLDWLEKNKLLSIAKNNSVYLKKVLQDCLAIKDEEVLIIADKGFEDKKIAPALAGSYYFAAKDLGLKTKILIQEPKFKGDLADKEVIETLYNFNRKNVIILALSNKLGSIKELGNSFRVYASENYHRFISSTSLGRLSLDKFPDIIKVINVDYQKMHETGVKLKEKLDNAETIQVKTDKGTDLTIGIKGKEAVLNTGLYTKPRTGGNVPAGEVYIAPKWKNVEGKVVIDASSSYIKGTQLIKEPITLTIEKDEVVKIEGGKEADNLRETLDWAAQKAKYPWGVRRIGEFGIGINPNADIIGATIVDEKKLGTAHVAIGSNYWFGGTIYAIIHLDQVFHNPKIYIDGKLLKI